MNSEQEMIVGATLVVARIKIRFMKKIIENLVVFVATVVVLFLLATIILPKFDYSLIVIRSGSMEPTIKTGSALLIKKQSEYKEGDVITFVKIGKEIVTHRITQVAKNDNGEITYKTKGDANDAEDVFSVKNSRVLGKTVIVMPYVGYMIAFFKSKLGVVLLILLPAGYFIGREMIKIKNELVKKKQKSE